MAQARKPVTTAFAIPLLKGAVAGCVATGPMTLVMLVAHRYLPTRQRSSLPPKTITMHLAERLGLKKHMNEPQRRRTTWISHVAYGAAMGALYGPLARRVPLPSVVKGTAFGLAVWAASYLGGLPAMGMPEAATDQPMQRNALMIGAHAVWGSVMGLVLDLTER